ncbi:hypothetical protein L208DRAFT_1316292, partial [Tricholoma matsutake]
GWFPALAVGISYGGGQKEPLNMKNVEQNATTLAKLCSSTSIMCISGFQSSVFTAYAPRVYEFYSSNLNILLNQSPFLRWNFQQSIFLAMTITFGPATITKPHTDPGNLSWGQCVITSLGEFNADRSGHLALWHLGLVIQFPPGSTIIIPSAILLHSNVKILDGEERYSIMQITTGGLLWWVYNGFCSDKTLLSSLRSEERAKWERNWESCFEEGLRMFSTVEELTCKSRG